MRRHEREQQERLVNMKEVTDSKQIIKKILIRSRSWGLLMGHLEDK